MSQMVHQVHRYVLQPHLHDNPPDANELAAEAQRLAQGGFVVSMEMPDGEVIDVGPDDNPPDVVDRFKQALGQLDDEDEPEFGGEHERIGHDSLALEHQPQDEHALDDVPDERDRFAAMEPDKEQFHEEPAPAPPAAPPAANPAPPAPQMMPSAPPPMAPTPPAVRRNAGEGRRV